MTTDLSAVAWDTRSFGGWTAYCEAARALTQNEPAQSTQHAAEAKRRASDADSGCK
jgi:hypothetical protein